MIREALIEMGKEKLIGAGLNCLVPAESRQEREANRSTGKGGNKSQSANKDQGGQKALTRFSEDQFADRKPKSKGGKPSSTAKSGSSKAGGQGNSSATSKQRPPKKNVWGTTPKHQR